MLEISTINDKIQLLFDSPNLQKDFGKNKLLIPGFYNMQMFDEDAEILFVGMNPAGYLKNFDSWSKKYKDITQEEKRKNIESESYKGEDKPYSYYKAFINLYPNENEKYNWNHIDLFQYRWTNQKDVLQEIKLHKDSFDKQYDITVELINLLKPKVIIVVNAGASEYLKNKWDLYNLEGELKREMFNKKDGYWLTPKNEFNKQYPVLFTGMLSGQRALDLGTRDILKFHIEKILKSIKK